MSGFVYFVRCQDRVKIGYSEDPVKRLSKINTDAPYPCDLVGYVSVDDFPERELHERFAGLRVHGEWFAPSPDLEAFVVSLVGRCFQPRAWTLEPCPRTYKERVRLCRRLAGLRIGNRLYRIGAWAPVRVVAKFFGVDDRTVRRWMSGEHAVPYMVALLLKDMPVNRKT